MEEQHWKLTVFLFSGRPNPDLVLKPKEISVWNKWWAEAALSDRETKLPNKLGYTGCRLQKDTKAYWLIFDGYVSYFEDGSVLNKKDPGRLMEHFLWGISPEEIKEIFKSKGML